jgi:hypothetical protein
MKFRKKPVVIEAVRWDGNKLAMMRFLGDERNGTVRPGINTTDDLIVRTLEGDMRCTLGDWLIRGVKGELYPCKPDIFAATYEPAE